MVYFSDPKKLKEKLLGDVKKNSVTLNELNKKLNASRDQAKSFKNNVATSAKEDHSDYNYYKNQRVSSSQVSAQLKSCAVFLLSIS